MIAVEFPLILLMAPVFGLLASFLAKSKGYDYKKWFLLGFVFGIIALIVISFKSEHKPGPTPETHVKCPDCREFVIKEASVCKHCSCKLIPQ